MTKLKTHKPILKLVPPSPWLQKIVNGIPYYWVHVPSRRSGIHIRGLAELCGVHKRAIENAIKNAIKVGSDLANLRTTEINSLLKNRTIFLEDLANLRIKGGFVKIICADVCADLIHYYAMKGKTEAIKSLGLFLKFGIEQYIFTKVGFIPTPESIMIDNIDYFSLFCAYIFRMD